MPLTEPAHDGRAQALDKSPQRFHMPGGRCPRRGPPGRFRTEGPCWREEVIRARKLAAASKPRPTAAMRSPDAPEPYVLSAHAIPRGTVTAGLLAGRFPLGVIGWLEQQLGRIVGVACPPDAAVTRVRQRDTTDTWRITCNMQQKPRPLPEIRRRRVTSRERAYALA